MLTFSSKIFLPAARITVPWADKGINFMFPYLLKDKKHGICPGGKFTGYISNLVSCQKKNRKQRKTCSPVNEPKPSWEEARNELIVSIKKGNSPPGNGCIFYWMKGPSVKRACW